MRSLYDCMITEMVLNQGKSTSKGFYSLQGMASRYVGYKYSNKNQLALWDHLVLKKNIRESFSSLSQQPFSARQITYGAMDVILPLLIKDKQLEVVSQQGLETCVSLENSYLEVLSEMEFVGIYLDQDKWLKNEDEYRTALQEAEDKLSVYVLVNNLGDYLDINWNSSQQVSKLFDEIGIPIWIVDKEKSTDTKVVKKATVSEAHIAKYKKKFDIIPLYLHYKHMHKLVSTYGEKFLSNINPKTGRIHSNYYQILNTGRISSSKPNLQNVPGDKRPGFRECFVPSKDTRKLVVADYSSQESRVLADISGEPNMINFFLGEDTDMHSYTARRMYGVQVQKEIEDDEGNIIQEGINEHLRFKGKVLNFSIAYGASAHKLQDTFQIPYKEAQDMINKFYKSYPKLKPYFSIKQASSIKQGFILIDNVTMRRAYHPQQETFEFLHDMMIKWEARGWRLPYVLYNKYMKILGEIKRNSQNWPIQGTSGSMTKLAAIKFMQWVRQNDLFERVAIVNMVHDEIVVECDSDIAHDAAQQLQNAMEVAGEIFVTKIPMPASPVIANYWTH